MFFLLDLLNWPTIGKRHSHLSRLRPGAPFLCLFQRVQVIVEGRH